MPGQLEPHVQQQRMDAAQEGQNTQAIKRGTGALAHSTAIASTAADTAGQDRTCPGAFTPTEGKTVMGSAATVAPGATLQAHTLAAAQQATSSSMLTVSAGPDNGASTSSASAMHVCSADDGVPVEQDSWASSSTGSKSSGGCTGSGVAADCGAEGKAARSSTEAHGAAARTSASSTPLSKQAALRIVQQAATPRTSKAPRPVQPQQASGRRLPPRSNNSEQADGQAAAGPTSRVASAPTYLGAGARPAKQQQEKQPQQQKKKQSQQLAFHDRVPAFLRSIKLLPPPADDAAAKKMQSEFQYALFAHHSKYVLALLQPSAATKLSCLMRLSQADLAAVLKQSQPEQMLEQLWELHKPL